MASFNAPTHGHTERDAAALVAAGVDPSTTQPREHPVRCWCGTSTLNQRGTCDAHWVEPYAATRAKRTQRLIAAALHDAYPVQVA